MMEDLSAIVENIKKAIIVTTLPDGKSGSGFFVSPEGLLITNKHTVGLNTFIRITLHDGTETDAKVVWADNDIDFALAVAETGTAVAIPLGNSDSLKDGQPVIAIGHPYGYDFTVSKGIVSCRDRVVKGIHYVQTDVPINPGNSGGPLINTNGEAVGINTWVVGDADNMSFAIPVNSVKLTTQSLTNDFQNLRAKYYCPICGYLNNELIQTAKAEYCMNCGSRKVVKEKAQEISPAPTPQPVNVALVTCPQCRTANDSTSNFCKNCGHKLK